MGRPRPGTPELGFEANNVRCAGLGFKQGYTKLIRNGRKLANLSEPVLPVVTNPAGAPPLLQRKDAIPPSLAESLSG
jgi:hypothetical protein